MEMETLAQLEHMCHI